MKKLLLFGLLVIILVCLNWFQQAKAQIPGNLSEADKVKILSKLNESKSSGEGVNKDYSTPPIYGSSVTIKEPENYSGANNSGLSINNNSDKPEKGLTPFNKLKPFGVDLFTGPREAIPPDDIASAPDYPLGPGDNLIVTLWGEVDKEYRLTVDREGKVFVPRMGEIIAWGKTLGEFESQLGRKLNALYGNFQLNVSLGKIRSIRIYLTGEVKRPGAYTVTSLTSLFNALYLAGGPNNNGSMRNIKLKRKGKVVAEVDLYKFLLEGDNSSDIRLESGDAIFIPVVGLRVALRGFVRREAIYELKDGQNAEAMLNLAGGAMAEAYLSRVMLERIADHDEWEVIDLDLNVASDQRGGSELILDGDRITVYSVYQIKTNMVAAFGMLKHPGYYERSDSTRISDLLERSLIQDYNVHFQRANLFRKYENWRTEVIKIDLNEVIAGNLNANLLLADGDSLHVYSIEDLSWNRHVSIAGKVKKPGSYPLYDNMTLEDLIFLAGSITRGASMFKAEIARFDSKGIVTVQVLNLNQAGTKETYLHEDDRVYIRTMPQWELHRTVILSGEVQYPGEYILASYEETLYELITRAGGLTKQSFPGGTILERKSIGENLEKMRIQALIKRSSPLVEDTLGNIKRSELFEWDSKSMNRIILDAELLIASNGEIGDITLAPGDNIHIPARPSGISVLGAVGSGGTLAYREKEKVKHYVNRAGNFTRESDKKGVRLIRANGEVYSGGGTLGKRVELGDVIIVPTKIHKERHWGKTVTTVLSTTTGILTTILLIDRL